MHFRAQSHGQEFDFQESSVVDVQCKLAEACKVLKCTLQRHGSSVTGVLTHSLTR
jgi:hypothetical protein